jgi:hypothetical protein
MRKFLKDKWKGCLVPLDDLNPRTQYEGPA